MTCTNGPGLPATLHNLNKRPAKHTMWTALSRSQIACHREDKRSRKQNEALILAVLIVCYWLESEAEITETVILCEHSRQTILHATSIPNDHGETWKTATKSTHVMAYAAKINQFTLDAFSTRQSLVKGERLVRHELKAVLIIE